MAQRKTLKRRSIQHFKRREKHEIKRRRLRAIRRSCILKDAPPSKKFFYNKSKKKWIHHFECPSTLNLSGNYDDTVDFLMQFRQWGDVRRRSRFYLDMRPIASITPAGGLLLAAELDRWSRIHQAKLKAQDVDQWDPGVRTLLRQMGFFTLLEADRPDEFELTPGDVEFLPFFAGDNSDGRPFLALRDRLEALVGRLSFRPRLFQAVSEALINVGHHAYSKKISSTNMLRRWWLSASVDKAKREVTVMVLDHGIGIPRTLPRKFGENLRRYLGVATLAGFNDDSKMIEAAVKLGRSSTGSEHRGHGLSRDISSFVDAHKKSCRLRIFSNRGCFEYSKDVDGKTSSRLLNHDASLRGTFLEWKFAI